MLSHSTGIVRGTAVDKMQLHITSKANNVITLENAL